MPLFPIITIIVAPPCPCSPCSHHHRRMIVACIVAAWICSRIAPLLEFRSPTLPRLPWLHNDDTALFLSRSLSHRMVNISLDAGAFEQHVNGSGNASRSPSPSGYDTPRGGASPDLEDFEIFGDFLQYNPNSHMDNNTPTPQDSSRSRSHSSDIQLAQRSPPSHRAQSSTSALRARSPPSHRAQSSTPALRALSQPSHRAQSSSTPALRALSPEIQLAQSSAPALRALSPEIRVAQYSVLAREYLSPDIQLAQSSAPAREYLSPDVQLAQSSAPAREYLSPDVQLAQSSAPALGTHVVPSEIVPVSVARLVSFGTVRQEFSPIRKGAYPPSSIQRTDKFEADNAAAVYDAMTTDQKSLHMMEDRRISATIRKRKSRTRQTAEDNGMVMVDDDTFCVDTETGIVDKTGEIDTPLDYLHAFYSHQIDFWFLQLFGSRGSNAGRRWSS
jgi:hypothetical protein